MFNRTCTQDLIVQWSSGITGIVRDIAYPALNTKKIKITASILEHSCSELNYWNKNDNYLVRYYVMDITHKIF